MTPLEIKAILQKFSGGDLTATLSRIEQSVKGITLRDSTSFLQEAGVSSEVLAAADGMKRLASQINVVIHAAGILLCLPRILEDGEIVEYVSLGAGNTGREFDLETNLRVAEFKFIHWRGGPESIRQNSIFKDFFVLAESASPKRKYLYVLGTEHPLRFLNGGRALTSVLSRNVRLQREFHAKFGTQYRTVREYFLSCRDRLMIQDVSAWVPELVRDVLDEDSKPDRKFLRSTQNFIANAFSISIVRRMGPKGTLDCVRTFLKTIDLAALSKKAPSQYPQTLDGLTENLRQALPRGARKWGVARKCLNLFFRDALYNFYLRTAYDLAKFEKYLEIPLDSYVGRELRREDDRLPRWRTVKGLTREESAKFQEVASQIAKRKKTHPVHLDVVYWRGEQNSK